MLLKFNSNKKLAIVTSVAAVALFAFVMVPFLNDEALASPPPSHGHDGGHDGGHGHHCHWVKKCHRVWIHGHWHIVCHRVLVCPHH